MKNLGVPNGKILKGFLIVALQHEFIWIFNLLTDQRSAGYKFRFLPVSPFFVRGYSECKISNSNEYSFYNLYRTPSEPQTKVQTQSSNPNLDRTSTEPQPNLDWTSTEPQPNISRTLTEPQPDLNRTSTKPWPNLDQTSTKPRPNRM